MPSFVVFFKCLQIKPKTQPTMNSGNAAAANPQPHLSSRKLFQAYCKPDCPYSQAAIELFTKNGFAPPKHVDIFVTDNPATLAQMTGNPLATTFPQIYLKRKNLIGGFDALKKYFKRFNGEGESDDGSGSDDESGSGSGSDDDGSGSGSGSQSD